MEHRLGPQSLGSGWGKVTLAVTLAVPLPARPWAVQCLGTTRCPKFIPAAASPPLHWAAARVGGVFSKRTMVTCQEVQDGHFDSVTSEGGSDFLGTDFPSATLEQPWHCAGCFVRPPCGGRSWRSVEVRGHIPYRCRREGDAKLLPETSKHCGRVTLPAPLLFPPSVAGLRALKGKFLPEIKNRTSFLLHP